MANYTINDLLYLMARLRDPDRGCPWGLEADESNSYSAFDRRGL